MPVMEEPVLIPNSIHRETDDAPPNNAESLACGNEAICGEALQEIAPDSVEPAVIAATPCWLPSSPMMIFTPTGPSGA